MLRNNCGLRETVQNFFFFSILHFSISLFFSGRKRRGSESALSDSSSDDYFYSMMWGSAGSGNVGGDENRVCYSPLVMSDCTAAMVLMNLSCSPTAVKLRAAQAAASSSHPALAALAGEALVQLNGDITYEHQQSDSTSKIIINYVLIVF